MKNTCMIFLIGIFVFNNLNAQKFIFSAKVDLNSDNKIETIKVENTDKHAEFKLFIDDKEIIGKFDSDNTDGFKVIDINKNDKYKEIAVHTPGPSDDDEYDILV